MEWTEKLVYSSGIPAVPRTGNSWNSVPNHYLKEKNAWNSVQWDKNEANPWDSVPYHSSEEKNARKMQKKWEQTLVIPFRTTPRKRIQLGIPFRGSKIEANSWNSVSMHLTTFELWTN